MASQHRHCLALLKHTRALAGGGGGARAAPLPPRPKPPNYQHRCHRSSSLLKASSQRSRSIFTSPLEQAPSLCLKTIHTD